MPALANMLSPRATLLKVGQVLGPAAGMWRLRLGGREILATSAAGALRTGARVLVSEAAGGFVVMGEDRDGTAATVEVIVGG